MRTSDRALRCGRPAAAPRRLRRLALVALTALAAIAGLQAAAPERALAIAELERVYETWEPGSGLRDTDPFKQLVVECPDGKLAIGGGMEIDDGFRDKVHLTSYTAARDYFYVSAEREFLFADFAWGLTGFAICADQDVLEDDDHAVSYPSTTVESSSLTGFRPAASPRCPSGTVAYSAGASLPYALGRIGLQMVRTDTAMTIGRGTGRMIPGAAGLSPQPWRLTVQAVCAKPIGGPHVDAEGASSDDPRTASTTCPASFFVHGAMGGSSRPGITDAGFTWLKMIFPSSSLKSTIVQMTGPNAGGPVAWATCATGR